MKRLALLTLPLALTACTKAPQDTPPAQTAPAAAATAPANTALDAAALGGYHWQLDQALDAKGQRIEALFARADRPLQLDLRDGRVSVSNTCNRMSGGYTIAGDKLEIARLASTMMACADPKLMALDQDIGQRLQAPQTLALRSGDTPQLTLTSAGGDVLTFRGEATADTRYGGPGATAFYEVAAQTQPCSHPLIPDKQCLQVRELHYDERGLKSGTPGEWQPLYQDIEGYEHVNGVRNVVRLKRYAVKNPPADASSVAYVLDMVVESETVKAK
ncbi:META domain-containing protein [Lysobacter cavernae]|uniref:META domain-containing protein n=1 Tax=Lysobacter cavernae TaxID=1685901 RepID=A0ABV7RSP3_9GAMM